MFGRNKSGSGTSPGHTDPPKDCEHCKTEIKIQDLKQQQKYREQDAGSKKKWGRS